MYSVNLYAKCPARREPGPRRDEHEQGELVGWGRRRRRSLSTGRPSARSVSPSVAAMNTYRESHEEFRQHSVYAHAEPNDLPELPRPSAGTADTHRRSSGRVSPSPSPLPSAESTRSAATGVSCEPAAREAHPGAARPVRRVRRKTSRERMNKKIEVLEENDKRQKQAEMERRKERMSSRPWLDRSHLSHGNNRSRYLRNREGHDIENPQCPIDNNKFHPLQYHNASAFADVLTSSVKRGANFRSASPRLGNEQLLRKAEQNEEERHKRLIGTGMLQEVPYSSVRSSSAPAAARRTVDHSSIDHGGPRVLESRMGTDATDPRTIAYGVKHGSGSSPWARSTTAKIGGCRLRRDM